MVELGIGGAVDLAHPALADDGSDVVMAESGTDLKRHDLWMENLEVILCPSGPWLQRLHGIAAEKRANAC